MEIRILFEKIRDQFWLLPTLILVGSILILIWTIQIPNTSPDQLLLNLFFQGFSPEGARLILSSIATAVMTVVGVLFSLTIVVLQQASSQHSPRVIETFIRSYPSQIVLGTYIGTFAFSLLLLRQIHGSSNGEIEIPQAAISTSILLVMICMGLLIYYINYLAHSIKSTSIITNIQEQTLHYLKQFNDETSSFQSVQNSFNFTQPFSNSFPIYPVQAGYLQSQSFLRTQKLLAGLNWRMKVHFPPGDYIDHEDCMATVETNQPLHDSLKDSLRKTFLIGSVRNHAQDPKYGIRQLVDIALRALSPGINDPTTAIESLNRIGTILKFFTLHCQIPQELRFGQNGRMLLPEFSYKSILSLAFEELILFSQKHPRVRKRICEILLSLSQEAKIDSRKEVCLKMLQNLDQKT